MELPWLYLTPVKLLVKNVTCYKNCCKDARLSGIIYLDELFSKWPLPLYYNHAVCDQS